MRIVQLLLLCIEILNANHTDDTDVITEDFPYKTNSETYEENILLPRDPSSGCLCRNYPTSKYVAVYDELCKRFPKDLQLNTTHIRVTHSAISVFYEDDFALNFNLTELQFEANKRLRRIKPGTFNGLMNLVNLSITHNEELLFLENDTFKGLTKLLYLKIYNNGFARLKDFTHSINAIALPRLKRLVIAQMMFPVVQADDFESVLNMSIENLNLFTCKIEHLHPIALSKFHNLKVLGLGENYLNSTNVVNLIGAIIKFGIPLEYISLYNLGFKEIPIDVLNAIAKSNITHLNLSKNRFERIEAFPAMPNIKRLDLSSVVALNIAPNAFQSLTNLKLLYLNNNQLSEVPQAALLSQLNYLDLSNSGNYFTLQDEIFMNMTNLTTLNLSGNNLIKLTTSTFFGLKNLEALNLRESKVFYIDNGTFAYMEKLKWLDLSVNPFPTRLLVASFFEGLGKLEVLELRSCDIGNIKQDSALFSAMVGLKHLDLQNNGLQSIPAEILEPLCDLEVFDISNNNFLNWNFRMFTNNKRLHTLEAYGNKITNITNEMIQDFVKLQKLNLQYNPFGCKCEDMNALINVMYNKDFTNIFNILSQYNLTCTYPDNYDNYTILNYLDLISETHICDAIISTNAINIILLALLAFTVLFIAVIIFVYRWQIRYWMFLTKLFLSRAGKLAKVHQRYHYQYDAFVSYCNEDQSFVQKLVGMLENQAPHYKLCLYERDFQIGTVISESVVESLSKSRKTLLIVSEAYIKSHWCRWEAQVAENHRLFFENEFGECSNDTLVIVKLGTIRMKNVSPMLKYLMKTRIYLQWDSENEHIFWEKLRNSLSRPKTVANYFMMVNR